MAEGTKYVDGLSIYQRYAEKTGRSDSLRAILLQIANANGRVVRADAPIEDIVPLVTLERLDAVRHLNLNLDAKINDLSFLYNTPNLTSLELKIMPTYLNFDTDQVFSGEYRRLLDQNLDLSALRDLALLEKIKITELPSLRYIDVSENSSLRTLSLSSLPNLQQIKGLEKLTNLNDLSIIGCGEAQKDINILGLLEQNANLKNLKLDTKLILDNIHNDPQFLEKLVQYGNNHHIDIKCCDLDNRLFSPVYTEISLEQMQEIINMAQEINSQIIYKDMSPEVKLLAMHYYIAKNISYDHEGAKKYSQLSPNAPENKNIRSAYTAFKHRSVVCAGYATALMYLARLEGIDADVCSVFLDTDMTKSKQKSTTVYGNHLLIRVNIDGKTYYCDPTFDNNRVSSNEPLKHFLLNRQEVEQYAKLSVTQKDVVNAPKLTDMAKQYYQSEYNYYIDADTDKLYQAPNLADMIRDQQDTQITSNEPNIDTVLDIVNNDDFDAEDYTFDEPKQYDMNGMSDEDMAIEEAIRNKVPAEQYRAQKEQWETQQGDMSEVNLPYEQESNEQDTAEQSINAMSPIR